VGQGNARCPCRGLPLRAGRDAEGLDALLRQPAAISSRSWRRAIPTCCCSTSSRKQKNCVPSWRNRAANCSRQLPDDDLRSSAWTRRGREAWLRVVRWHGPAARGADCLRPDAVPQPGRFQEVDRALLERTHTFLLSRRDSKGGFTRDAKGPDGPPAHVSDAYIVWALTESGRDNVKRELNALAVRAKTSKDPYFLALVANSLASRQRAAEAGSLLQTIVKAQKEDGHLDAEQTSVTGSRGRDLQIETTPWRCSPGSESPRDDSAFRSSGRSLAWPAARRLRPPSLDAGDGPGPQGAGVPRGGVAGGRGRELSLSVGGQRVARLAFKAGATGPLVTDGAGAGEGLEAGANSVPHRDHGQESLACDAVVVVSMLRAGSASRHRSSRAQSCRPTAAVRAGPAACAASAEHAARQAASGGDGRAGDLPVISMRTLLAPGFKTFLRLRHRQYQRPVAPALNASRATRCPPPRAKALRPRPPATPPRGRQRLEDQTVACVEPKAPEPSRCRPSQRTARSTGTRNRPAAIRCQASTARAVVSICRSRPREPVTLVCSASRWPSSFWAFDDRLQQRPCFGRPLPARQTVGDQGEEVRVLRRLRRTARAFSSRLTIVSAALRQRPDDVGVANVSRRTVRPLRVAREATLAIAAREEEGVRPLEQGSIDLLEAGQVAELHQAVSSQLLVRRGRASEPREATLPCRAGSTHSNEVIVR